MSTRSLFADRDYRHLFTAQIVALLGTGLTTVALGLLAFQLAGPRAGAVLGTALTIKMMTYVLVAPVAGGYADRVPRRRLLVLLDLVRALVVVALPFVGQIWQVYILVAVLQTASAVFTPTFQAVLPDILPDEHDYTRALSYAQLASTMESLLSPLVAGLLLGVMSFHWLFTGTSIGFLASAALVASTSIPDATRRVGSGVRERVFAGMRLFAATPRLRGLMGLNLAVAAIGAVVMVNTVNLVQESLGRPQADVAWALAANGAGVIVAAVAAPPLLGRLSERTVMLTGAALLVAAGGALVALSGGDPDWTAVLGVWALIGTGTGLVLTPIGRVLRRSSAPRDRPALFAAQFSLSHACWLLAYPIAGWVATVAGFTVTWTILGALAVAGMAIAVRCWPRTDAGATEHTHPADG